MVPMGTFSFIARELGVSRERVRQRAERLNISTVRIFGTERVCACGKIFMVPTWSNKMFCSRTCSSRFRTHKLIEFTCQFCNKSFIVRDTVVRRRQKYCNRSCNMKNNWAKGLIHRPRRKMLIRTCSGCGSIFETNRPDQKYHSHPCFINHLNRAKYA